MFSAASSATTEPARPAVSTGDRSRRCTLADEALAWLLAWREQSEARASAEGVAELWRLARAGQVRCPTCLALTSVVDEVTSADAATITAVVLGCGCAESLEGREIVWDVVPPGSVGEFREAQ
jgi:hypothetical protein